MLVGGAILAFIGSAYLVYKGIMPESTIESIKFFMDDTDFLNLFISVLITGSILAVNRKLLVKALTGYIPAILAGILGAFIFGAIGGLITGVSPMEVAMKYVPTYNGRWNWCRCNTYVREIYKSVTGGDPKEFLSLPSQY